MKLLRLTIKAKITLLAASGILFLAFIGVVGIYVSNTLAKQSSITVEHDALGLSMLDGLRETEISFHTQVQEWKNILLRGTDAELYAKYHAAFERQHNEVEANLDKLREQAVKIGFNPASINTLSKEHIELHQRYLDALKSFNANKATTGMDVDKLVRGVDRPTGAAMDKLAQDVVSFTLAAAEKQRRDVDATDTYAKVVTALALLVSLPLLIIIAVFTARSIVGNLALFQKTIQMINQGNADIRAKTDTGDELAELARAFNNLLDDRVATLAEIERENEKLNESVLNLLRAVAELSRRDLTIHVPVSDDVTGTLSDALNLLTQEMAKVLQDVANISAEVTSASLKVQNQATSMRDTAKEERSELEKTTYTLSNTAVALKDIASLAHKTSLSADNATRTTLAALKSVDDTVHGINSTRDVIRETEKRIKRLGERSQEISGAVGLINTIAERTHILALNASMHAASAGEAGRGFAVVADEVQRLAENSRQATQQIAALVNNIQVETADTVNTMNDAISKIVEGSRLAETAGQQMHMTQEVTDELVAAVKQIAASSERQAQTGQELIELASMIKISSEKAGENLESQSQQTNNLVEYAKQLLSAVRVFKLPA